MLLFFIFALIRLIIWKTLHILTILQFTISLITIFLLILKMGSHRKHLKKGKCCLNLIQHINLNESKRTMIMTNIKNKIQKMIPVLFLSIFFFLSFTTSIFESPTYDELHYLAKGSYLLKYKKWDIPSCLFHPPLFYYATSILLLPVNIPEEIWHTGYNINDLNSGQEIYVSLQMGKYILSRLPFDIMLMLARFLMILLGVLLGFFIFYIARK